MRNWTGRQNAAVFAPATAGRVVNDFSNTSPFYPQAIPVPKVHREIARDCRPQ